MHSLGGRLGGGAGGGGAGEGGADGLIAKGGATGAAGSAPHGAGLPY
jgi:hypothetical protein